MTALARRLSSLRIEALAAGAILFVIAVALAIVLIPARDPANAVTIPMTSAKAAALVEATTGTQASDLRAIGDEAKLINAALPFANGPVHSASPFLARGGDLDQQRALLCLTQAVYYEAGFEPLEGRRAVAQVILNRLRHPAFPKSVCGVVYQGAGGRVCQFTFVCDGALYRAPARDAWLVAEQVARAALAGYVETRVGEATHYHADYVAPRWAPLLAKVSQIGQHIFYRWPGAWGQPAAFNGRYIGEPRDPLAMRPPPPANPLPGTTEVATATDPLTDGTVLAHAPNDVGGLLDTSKGWTLSIPGPDDSGSAARSIASQQGKPAPAAPASTPAAAAVAAAGATQVASR